VRPRSFLAPVAGIPGSCANVLGSEISPLETVLTSGGAKGNPCPYNAIHPFNDSVIQSFLSPRLPDFRSNTVS
jgi:hypothetical protein